MDKLLVLLEELEYLEELIQNLEQISEIPRPQKRKLNLELIFKQTSNIN